jgi:hypothetical protein
VLVAVEVPAGDAEQSGLRDPLEDLAAVDQLVAVDETRERMPVDCPATGPTWGRHGIVGRIRMGGDQRRAGSPGCNERALQAAVEGDHGAQADRDCVGRDRWLLVVVGELEPGNEQQAVLDVRAPGLLLDLADVVGERPGIGDPPAWVVPPRAAPPDVVGDAEDVEAARAVEVDEFRDGEIAVAPVGVSVQLAQKRASAHRSSLRPG